jgi:cyclopropane fatty-acyl-phospholipid synthase-like methyltransferase
VALPPPVVPPEAYTEDYFRRCCGHAEEWDTSGGRELAGIYSAILTRSRFGEGEVVVDIGTGRGELPTVAAQQGARRAIGVEYAPAAIALARQTAAAHGVTGRTEFILADARAIPLEDGIADLVTLLDVVEHLAPGELDRTLAEARRLLRGGGRIEIHTFPTKTLYNVTYRWQRLSRASRRKNWPRDPRNKMEHLMHVNEQSLWSLRRSLRRAGFTHVDVEAGEWVYTDFVPDERARRLYRGLARLKWTRPFGSANLFASATKGT